MIGIENGRPYLDNGDVRYDIQLGTAGGGIGLITIRNTPDGVVRYRSNVGGILTGRNVWECGYFGVFRNNGSIQDMVGQWNPVQGYSIDNSGDTGGVVEWNIAGDTLYVKSVFNIWWGEAGVGVDANASGCYCETWYRFVGSLLHIRYRITQQDIDRDYWKNPIPINDSEMFYDYENGPANGGTGNLANWYETIGFGYTDDSKEDTRLSFTGACKTVGYFGNAPWTGAALYGAGPGEDIKTKDNNIRFNGVSGGEGLGGRVPTDERWIADVDTGSNYAIATYCPDKIVQWVGTFDGSSGSGPTDAGYFPWSGLAGTVTEFNVYRGYGDLTTMRAQFADINTALNTAPGVVQFVAQPAVVSTTSTGGVISYGTGELFSDDLTVSATSATTIADARTMIEGVQSTITALATLVDTLVTSGQLNESVTAAASVITSATDAQSMVDTVTAMATSGASVAAITSYLESVVATASASATVQDTVIVPGSGQVSAPVNLQADYLSPSSARLTWDMAIGPVAAYLVTMDGTPAATIPAGSSGGGTGPSSYALTAYLDGEQTTIATLRGVDANGNIVVDITWPDVISGGHF